MVRILVVIILYFISLVNYAQNSNNSEIETNSKSYQINVQVKNVTSDSGKVYFALYNSEKGFNERSLYKGEMSDIKNGVATVKFSDLEPNTYAIVCFHDANDNKKMDFEKNGMPLEDYGVSNNVISYGPPQFSDAKFELKDKDLTFEIRL
jgi:uncharacterized protein (DUF2141 family)